MADDSWRDLELWDRVKWARALRFESATAAAAALDIQPGTYRCYERGPDSAKFIRLEYQHAKRFAKAFKVRWEWLQDGTGEPWHTKGGAGEVGATTTNNLRAWREYRGLTAAELARKVKSSAQVIADLESGAVELGDKWRSVLAPALGTRPGFLQDIDPSEVDPAFFETVSAIPKERRRQALEILQTFKPYHRPR